MNGPLEGAWAKLACGERHVQELKVDVLPVPGNAHAIQFGQEFDPQQNTIKIFVESVPPLPIEWATLAADALQDFRAALNYLAWELAKWNLHSQGAAREPADQTAFPIATVGSNYPGRAGVDLHPTHLAQIERLQPYDPSYVHSVLPGPVSPEGTPGAWRHTVESHPLAVLQRLSNADKHRVLRLIGFGVTSMRSGPGAGPPDQGVDCVLGSGSYYAPHEMKPGTPIRTYEVTPTGPHPRVDVHNGVFSVGAALEEGRSVEDTLDAVGVMVARIIHEFAPVFQ